MLLVISTTADSSSSSELERLSTSMLDEDSFDSSSSLFLAFRWLDIFEFEFGAGVLND